MFIRIFPGHPLFNHNNIIFVLTILVKACMQASALLSHLFNDRVKGLRKLFALFRPNIYSVYMVDILEKNGKFCENMVVNTIVWFFCLGFSVLILWNNSLA